MAKSAPLLFVYRSYIVIFFLYLVAPLLAAGAFAFNDSLFPSLPWQGFTLDWFFSPVEPKLGLFHDDRLLRGLRNSFVIGLIVSAMAVAAGTSNAFLFERRQFPFKRLLYILMIVPLVIPGVILGISILVFASMVANWADQNLGLFLTSLRPGVPLIILGQFSFLTTITSLVIAARLQKFDVSLEEAALNLGASRLRVLLTVTLAVPVPGAVLGLCRGVPGFLRELQHDADAGRRRRAADHHDVRPHGEGRLDAGSQRGLGLPDARLRPPRPGERAGAAEQAGGVGGRPALGRSPAEGAGDWPRRGSQRRHMSTRDRRDRMPDAYADAIAAGEDQPTTAFRALEALTDEAVGVRLFTLMTFDAAERVARRIYSNMPDAYPVSGTKPIEDTAWTRALLQRGEVFVANDAAGLAEVFFDHELIVSLGCEFVLNVPVVAGGVVLGTMNCLHEARYYTPERVAASDALRVPAVAAFLLARHLSGAGS